MEQPTKQKLQHVLQQNLTAPSLNTGKSINSVLGLDYILLEGDKIKGKKHLK